jgi:hypothetical protein
MTSFFFISVFTHEAKRMSFDTPTTSSVNSSDISKNESPNSSKDSAINSSFSRNESELDDSSIGSKLDNSSMNEIVSGDQDLSVSINFDNCIETDTFIIEDASTSSEYESNAETAKTPLEVSYEKLLK